MKRGKGRQPQREGKEGSRDERERKAATKRGKAGSREERERRKNCLWYMYYAVQNMCDNYPCIFVQCYMGQNSPSVQST